MSGPSGAKLQLPDDKILVPGVIDSVSNFVEHPELVAAAHLPLRGRRRS